jgi:hypothetical protein
MEEPSVGNDAVVEPVGSQALVVYDAAIAEANIAGGAGPTAIRVNTGNFFYNAATYKVRDELIQWCKGEALKAGFTMVIEKSDNGSNRRKAFFILGCERGGEYKEPKRKGNRDDTATRKCQCPFRLRGYFLATHEWRLSVVCGEHNHEMAKNLEGHILAGRLKPEEKEHVQELTRNLVQPKNILHNLKERNKESKTNMKQIYNIRQKYKNDLRGEYFELQQLLKCLEEHRYFHKIRTVGESSTVQDIFWAHPDSVKLLNTFPTVLLMDSTYKTNIEILLSRSHTDYLKQWHFILVGLVCRIHNQYGRKSVEQFHTIRMCPKNILYGRRLTNRSNFVEVYVLFKTLQKLLKFKKLTPKVNFVFLPDVVNLLHIGLAILIHVLQVVQNVLWLHQIPSKLLHMLLFLGF